jgi:hypothetical protein
LTAWIRILFLFLFFILFFGANQQSVNCKKSRNTAPHSWKSRGAGKETKKEKNPEHPSYLVGLCLTH